MKTWTYTIKDELGLHARPTGLLVREASQYQSDLKIIKNDGVEANLKKMFEVMKLNIRCEDTITISANGIDEDVAINKLSEFIGSLL